MISSKQRSYLRSLAVDLTPIFQIGKGGLNENMIKQIDDVLEIRELIKITVLKNSELSSRELSSEMAESTGAEVVQVIGSKFVLYRESKENKKIFLPK